MLIATLIAAVLHFAGLLGPAPEDEGIPEAPPAPSQGGQMETVTSADGTEIAFERTGSGPPLVLVHGTSNVHEFWELAGVRSAFAEHFTVYAVERRGRGESGDAVEYSLEREVEDVVAVVDSIDEPVALLGHSYGALLSLEAARRTDNLRQLILYEPPVPDTAGTEGLKELVAEMQPLVDAGENERALDLFLPKVMTSEELEELEEHRSEPIWDEKVDAAHTIPRELQTIAEYEFDAARFADMTTPTLMLLGGESPPSVHESTEWVSDALPNARIATLDGQAHVAMLTAPDRFTDKVLAFARESNGSSD